MEKGMYKTEKYEKIVGYCGACGKANESDYVKEGMLSERQSRLFKLFIFDYKSGEDCIWVCSPECLEKWVLKKLEQFKREW